MKKHFKKLGIVVMFLGMGWLLQTPLLAGQALGQVTLVERWDGVSANGGWGQSVQGLSDAGGNPADPRQDGIPDLIISKVCIEGCPANEGAVFVYSGSDRSLIFQITGTGSSYTLDAGDLDGDGIPDLFVGQLGNEKAQVFSGSDGSPIPWLEFLGDNDNGTPDQFGVCVSAIGDITGDGIQDLIVGAYSPGSSGGYVVIYSGSDGSRIRRIDAPFFDVASFGMSVSEAGDVDGDGTPDFIVGAPGSSPNGMFGAGSALVFSGRVDLDFPIIHRLDGENPGDRFGGCCGAVDSVGDLNGDGLTELAVSAVRAMSSAGSVYIFDGATGGGFQRFDGLGPLRFDGQGAGDYLGGGEEACTCGWMAKVGDVNFDGYPDFIAGASGADTSGGMDAGRALVFSGYDASVILVIENPDPLSTPHYFGISGAFPGDLNGDGLPELLVGASNTSPSNQVGPEIGSAYLFSLTAPDSDGDGLPDGWELLYGLDPNDATGDNGAAGDPDGDGITNLQEFLNQSSPVEAAAMPELVFSKDGSAAGDALGTSVYNGGDVDGDGVKDLIVGVGQVRLSAAPNVGPGRVEVYSGATMQLLFSIPGEALGDEFGYSVSGADVNSDGLTDVVVGAPFRDVEDPLNPGTFWADSGSVYVYLSGPPFDGSARLHNSYLWRRDGSAVNDRMGWHVGAINSDVNGDGVNDVVVGVPQLTAEIGGPSGELPRVGEPGKAFVFSGPDGSVIYEEEGETAGEHFGVCVFGVGDLDGDGRAEFIVGSGPFDAEDPLNPGTFYSNVGRAYVFNGSDGSIRHVIENPAGPEATDFFGVSVTGGSDVNGDGTPDFAVGANFADPGGQVDAGSVYLFSGVDATLLYQFNGENAGDLFGGCCGAISATGDVDGDGRADLVVSAPNADPGGLTDAGSVYVYGYDGTVFALIQRFDGEAAGDHIGAFEPCFCGGVANDGDMNGDGRAEIVIGAPHVDAGGLSDAGRVYVYSIPGPAVALTVIKLGTGSGTVTSSPAGINCGADCTESYTQGAVVGLTAVPDIGSSFAGWSGSVDCLDGQVTMDTAKTCRATFDPALDLEATALSATFSNGSVTIDDTVTNIGLLNAYDYISITFYASEDAVLDFDGTDTPFCFRELPGGLGAGQADSAQTVCPVPPGVLGNYLLSNVAIFSSTLVDTNPANNVGSLAVSIGADLEATALSATFSNGSVTIDDTVTNIGNVDADNVNVAFFVSADAVLDLGQDAFICDRLLPGGLGAGQADSAQTTCPIPPGMAGNYLLSYAVAFPDADPANNVGVLATIIGNEAITLDNLGRPISLIVPLEVVVSDFQWIDPATLPPSPAGDFPYGLLSITLQVSQPGGSATAILIFPGPVDQSSAYNKYGPTSGDPTDHWYTFPFGSNDGDATITLTLTDGGAGDHDLVADGFINDPGGPLLEAGSELINLSTRGQVMTGDNVQIGGFWIGGTEPKTVVLRARGPSMGDPPFNLPGTLADPLMRLFSGSTVIAQNDDWQSTDPLCAAPAVSCGDFNDIIASGLDPCQPNPGETLPPTGCNQESALYVTLPPGGYTAIVSGAGGGTGVGLVEVFEEDSTPVDATLVNISTRGMVLTGNDVMIGGFWIGGPLDKSVVLRARGPSMGGAPFFVPGVLPDPEVQLYSGSTDITQDVCVPLPISDPLHPCVPNPGESTPPPGCNLEEALMCTVPPGGYTAIVSGAGGGSGVGLIEVFEGP